MSILAISNIVETIFCIRDNPEKWDNEEILNYINEIIQEAKTNEFFYKDLENIYKDKLRSLDFCPECGSQLFTATKKIKHPELAEFSNEAQYEEYTYKYCICGWNIKGNDE